jgi:L-threonylcarbamoyladenylate synthase
MGRTPHGRASNTLVPMEVFDLSAGLSRAAVDAAAQALAGGGLVAFPTDTVYGLAARPDVPGATGRVFEAKRRPRGLTLPLLCPDLSRAEQVAIIDDRARSLAERFWPGGLTIVLRRSERSESWDLGDDRRTVGVRVPAHDVALAVLSRAGPLAVTSANTSGEPTPRNCDGVREALGETVDVYLCAGSTGGVASTIVDLTGAQPAVLRQGAVSSAVIEAALR